MELSARLASVVKSFVSEEGDIVKLKSDNGRAYHMFKLRECAGTIWHTWNPTGNLIDYDHIRQICYDRGYGFVFEYSPSTKLYTFTVVIGMRFYPAIDTDFKIASCQALLNALEGERILNNDNDNCGQTNCTTVKCDIYATADHNNSGCCGVDDEGCCNSGGRCGCKTENAHNNI